MKYYEYDRETHCNVVYEGDEFVDVFPATDEGFEELLRKYPDAVNYYTYLLMLEVEKYEP